MSDNEEILNKVNTEFSWGKVWMIIIASVIGMALTSWVSNASFQGETNTRLNHVEDDIKTLDEEKLDNKVMLEYIRANDESERIRMKLLDKHEDYSNEELDEMRNRLNKLEDRLREIEIKFNPNVLRSDASNTNANIGYSEFLNWTWEQGEYDMLNEMMSVQPINSNK